MARFYDLPSKSTDGKYEINWKYLTNNGKVYGAFDDVIIFSWDKEIWCC